MVFPLSQQSYVPIKCIENHVFICWASVPSPNSTAKIMLFSETKKDFAKIVQLFLFFKIECLILRLIETISNLI